MVVEKTNVFMYVFSTVNRFKQLLLESAAVTEVDLFLELKQNIYWFDLKGGVSFVKPRTINLFSFKYIYNICLND